MTGPEKVEFGSDAWMDLAIRTLDDVISEVGPAIAGERLTICEVFVDPPPHLRKGGTGEIAWSLVIIDGKAAVERRARQDVDYAVRADYQSILPHARAILSGSPAEREARAAGRREAIAAGKFEVKGSLDQVSPALSAALTELHNRLALRTA